MYVEIVRLRAKGERIEKNELHRQPPVRGYLNVHQRFDHRARRDVYVATVTRGDFATTEQLIPALDQVRLGRLTGNHFVLLGLEDLSYRKNSLICRQAWWCQLPSGHPAAALPFDDGDVT